MFNYSNIKVLNFMPRFMNKLCTCKDCYAYICNNKFLLTLSIMVSYLEIQIKIENLDFVTT